MAAEPFSAPGTIAPARAALVRRGRWLAWFTIGWNALEGLVAIATDLAAGSIALLGFGADSDVEVFAGSVVLWRPSRPAPCCCASGPRRACRGSPWPPSPWLSCPCSPS